MSIEQLKNEIHKNAIQKGFWDTERNVGEALMLVVSELGEAMEAHRKGWFCDPVELAWFFSTNDGSHAIEEVFPEKIKDTFEDEIADAVIRLLDLCGGLGIDIERHIEAKMEYNKTRERLHGKKY